MAAAAMNPGDGMKLLDCFSSKRERRHLAKGEQMSVRALINTSIIHTLKRKKIKLFFISYKCVQFYFENPNGVPLA